VKSFEIKSVVPPRAATLILLSALLLGSSACSDAPAAGTPGSGDEDSGNVGTFDATDDGDGSIDNNDIRAFDTLNGDADSGQIADADGSGEEAGIGSSCESDEDCPSPLECVRPDPTAPTGICTTACTDDDDCPEEWLCYTLASSGEDALQQCLPADLCIDGDNDGYGFGQGCRGSDCDDNDELINPAADETCNGVDDDCDDRIDDNTVEDRTPCETGFSGVCSPGRLSCLGGVTECIPDAALTAESCDSVDNNCDGIVDEGGVCEGEPCCYDEVCEGVCSVALLDASNVCSQPSGYGDEVCDGVDNDCDGETDETFAEDGDACDTGVAGLCAAGTLTCDGGESVCVQTVSSVDEVCDGEDNDCDGQVDNGVLTTWYLDLDEDGAGSAESGTVEACTAPEGYVALDNDCNDDDDAVLPGEDEIAGDGVDQNCDEIELCYRDRDNDGYRTDETFVSSNIACDGDGEASASDPADDCNDSNDETYPGAPETCNGVDDNCGGGPDEGGTCAGEPCDYNGLSAGVCGLARLDGGGVCAQPANFGADVCDGLDNDCDGDTDEEDTRVGAACVTGNPGICGPGTGACSDGRFACNANTVATTETCDGADNDCDGSTDEGVTTTYFRDQDNDGYGATANGTIQACSLPAGYRTTSNDCNDNVTTVNPGATETCNGVDDNCVGGIDEGVRTTYYRDQDNDGYGSTLNGTTQACSVPAGYRTTSNDCNDNVTTVNPGATETCNGIDDNCVGGIDEGVKTTYYRDQDNDGYGATTNGTTQACSLPSGYRTTSNDCNDNVTAVNPGATETCNGVDDNCVGGIDEGATCAFQPCNYNGSSNGVCGDAVRDGAGVCQRPAGQGREACDGVDNDCDGQTDEGNYPVDDTCCVTCTPPGGGTGYLNALDGEVVGVCRNRSVVCVARPGVTCTNGGGCF
jgi:hypothetical protein